MILKKNLYIIIPAYNEEKHIGDLVRDVLRYHDKIIVVDDGSSDRTVEQIRNKKVIVVRHEVNLGKGAALKTGFDLCFKLGGEMGIMLDADGQHKASDLTIFFKEINNNRNVILGYRVFSNKDPWVRKFFNYLAKDLIFFLFGKKIKDLTCGFRAISKNVYNKIRWESLSYGVETEMIVKIAKNNISYVEVPIKTIYYDNYKGVTIIDAINILINVIKWRII